MRLRDTVSSKWLKVDDLPGRERGHLDLTIQKVGMSAFSDGRESVDLYFHEHPKPLGCNATNRRRLLMLFGEDIELDDLIGHRIRVYAELTQDLKGVPCWGVRIGAIPETIQMSSAKAREQIAQATARHAAGGNPPPRTATRAPEPSRMPQAAPAEPVRPMSHRPQVETMRPVQLNEPAGFVDEQDPGPSDPFAGAVGGEW